MAGAPIFVSRVTRLPLVSHDGHEVGGITDVVVVPYGPHPARVLGLVASVQRRRVFLNDARVATIDPMGVRLRSSAVDVRPFRQRPGEKLVVADLFGQRIGDEVIVDVAIELEDADREWFATTVALGGRGPLRRRRTTRIIPWSEVGRRFDAGPEYAEVAELREMHAADVAERVGSLSPERRARLAELMEDDRLADLLEELPEDEQIRIIEGLDLERAAHVLEEMEPDDAADLLGELPETARQRLLAAMQPDESTPIRRLLTYDDDSAGGLMTPEPVILQGTATVAEALAVVREPTLPIELAAQVFVVVPPTSAPTGRYLGHIPFQRLLREAPSTSLADCVFTDPPAVSPDLPLRDVAERLAAYDALAVPVCDTAGRLVRAVTVDDVLDHVLPEGWRRKVRR